MKISLRQSLGNLKTSNSKLLVTRKQKMFLAIGVVILVCTLVVGFKLTVADGNRVAKRFYHKQLSSLGTAVSGIPALLELDDEGPKNIAGNLEVYNKQLGTILDICRLLITRQGEFTAKSSSQKIKDTIRDSALLCNDLTDVAVYSQDVYRSSADYLKTEGAWPQVDTPQYSQRLTQLTATVKLTGIDLRKIDNNKVKDPGLEELIFHIDESDKQIKQIQSSLALPDLVVAQDQTNQLSDKLGRDKINFLSARNYFWNNTIGIEDLKQAINKLLEQSR